MRPSVKPSIKQNPTHTCIRAPVRIYMCVFYTQPMAARRLWFFLFIHALRPAAAAAAASLWPCSPYSAVSPPCWTLPDTYDSLMVAHMWDCEKCGSGYSHFMAEEGYVACYAPKGSHLVAIPTELPGCSSSSFSPPYFVCDVGYYYSSASDECLPCLAQSLVTPCSAGYYHERCQTPTDTSVCKPCSRPALPNSTSYSYGPQRMLPECVPGLKRYPEDESCALFLTPSWDHYECELYCNVGYTNVNPLAGQTPDCQPCMDVCGLGFACSHISADYRQCTPCIDLNGGHPLPSNARWLPTCAWECVEGYYGDGLSCKPCLTNQACFNPLERFMGCAGESQGRCTPVNFTACEPNRTFLYYEVYSPHATCAPCAQPVLNASYMVSPCTQLHDTVLRPCSPRCAQPGHFITRECTLTSDVQCQPCTRGAMGQLMIEACGPRSDARFAPCPAGGACDGSATVLPCPVPKIPNQGLCICPPATRGSSVCLPLQCPDGWYPDASIDACSPCSSDPDSLPLLLTLPMRMGLDACACASGYFIQRNATTTGVECWPCGDLMCTPGLQAQWPSCSHAGQDVEPQCQCQLPQGTRLLDQDTCAFECAPDFDVSPLGANMTPGWWSLPFEPWLPEAEKEEQEAVLIAPDLAVLSQSATLVFVMVRQTLQVMHALNASDMLMQGTRERLIPSSANDDTHLLQLWASPEDAAEDRFWVGFSFETMVCGETVSILASITCSTVELLQVFREGSCAALGRPCFWVDQRDCVAVPVCPSLLATGIWGKTMQAGFTTGLIQDMTGGTDTLYLLLSTGCVHAYPVYFYAPETSQAARTDDTLQNTSLCSSGSSSTRTRTLAYVGGTLFLPGHSQGPAQNLFVPPLDAVSLTTLTPTRWLLMRTSSALVVFLVDVWNGVSWPVSVSLLAFHSASLSTLWSASSSSSSAGNGSLLQLLSTPSPLALLLACPLDTLRFQFHDRCTPMQCVKTRNACGNHSLRVVGSTSCVCLPGYYDRQAGCRLCPANAYCPGLEVAMPVECGANAVSAPGATSPSDCLCKAGHYPLEPAVCLPCPMGFWCLGGRTLPIPCMNSGTTFSSGSTSPLECVCPPRSYGLLCTPCAEDELCLLVASQAQPQWSAIRILGWGPATLRINDCALLLKAAAVYSIPGPTPMQNLSSSSGTVPWGWMLAVLLIDSTAPSIVLGKCLTAQGLVLSEPIATVAGPQTHRTFSKKQHCSMNEEWSGDEVNQACTCIAGYVLQRSSVSGFQRCMPCLNGSIRVRRAPPAICTPCEDNNSHAPWMAMSHCVCMDGYYFDIEASQPRCMPLPLSFVAMHPWLASPAAMISLSVVSGLLCLLGFVLAPRLVSA